MSGCFGQGSGQADLVAPQTVESRSPAGGDSDTKQRRSGPGAPFVDTAHRGKKIESAEFEWVIGEVNIVGKNKN